MDKFKDRECRKQQSLIAKGEIFDGDRGYGYFCGKRRAFVLEDGTKNLYGPIRTFAVKYFMENGISWWKGSSPSGHILSSQIACLNHLFTIRTDKDAVLAMLNGVRNEFVDVLPLHCDVAPQGYVAFEAVSSNDNLNERQTTRGSNCTSVDALVLARHANGKKWLVPIEWKYTESYLDQDKSREGYKSSDQGLESDAEIYKGLERMHRYNDLITASSQLKTLAEYCGSIYYQEPFYQLMRQTLWAEQIIKRGDRKLYGVDYFLHIHIIPSRNEALLQRIYKVSGKNMEDSWRDMLEDQSKYVIVDPERLMLPVKDRYPDLQEYLKIRYWS